jgi:cytochrome c-type biogenesis protein
MATHRSDHPVGPAAGAVVHRAGRTLAPAVVIAVALAGLGVLTLLGWLAWNQGALVGLRWVEFDSPFTLATFGFVAGIGAFFAPCAFALFPGYVSYYLASSGLGNESAGRSLLLGLACATGSAVFFAIVGVAITLLGGAIAPYLIATKPLIAGAVALLGIVLLADVRLPSLVVSLGAVGGRLPSGAALFLYGFGYALASTGCTLPIYVSSGRAASSFCSRASTSATTTSKRGCDMKLQRATLALLAVLLILLIPQVAAAELRLAIIRVKGMVCDS